MTVNDEVNEWIAKADTDYKAALDLARRRKDPLPDSVCFHCHQCVEKYLKAFLIAHSTLFPKTHDLILLNDMCSANDELFVRIRDALEELIGYDVAIRYPGAEATLEDAREAVKAMKRARRFIRARLGILVKIETE